MPTIEAPRAGWRKGRRLVATAVVSAAAVVTLGVILTRGREVPGDPGAGAGLVATSSVPATPSRRETKSGAGEPKKAAADPVVSPTPAASTGAAAPTSPATIDLLSRINPAARKAMGPWELRRGALFSTGTESGIVRLPAPAPSEYRIELTAARVRPGGMSDFTIGVVSGEHRCAVLLDGWGGTVSGISWIDGKVAIENETKYEGHIFPRGRPVDIVVTVRRRLIVVTVDGKTIVNWRGDPSRLSVDPPAPPGSRMLTIGASGGFFRVDKLTLTPLPDSPMRKKAR